ncbi:NO-inducible flavohemoprotein [Paenibacillus sp. J2TS4]|uniref:NO-inducible flavohemoprotein n=1 Tax=Paenibacillus sp. J2TS4 TaxID=2807194 RepID=UPI001B0F4BD9|nr:NO-inducible flavohemoprotein [Paenibacillus sp. J2TS4]GIP32324.1 flavohemoprotein [Paenibacillus sp. J2TS4]
MISKETIEVIKSTVPVLQQRGEEITTRFYQMMFANHPELLNIFNHANQNRGRQQTALAHAVLAAAQNIERLEAILPAVVQIAHKHRSLGVKPDHYPIVGKHLLMAIKDVLGEAATEEIIQAWAQAYQAIADVFIQVEAEMYEASAKQSAGWEGFRVFKVVKKVKESDVITSFYMEPADSGDLASYEPGQYVSIKLDIPGQKNTHIRQYSLSDRPDTGYYRISVKREDGRGGQPDGIVSTYLHHSVQEGDLLPLSAPAGHFTLDNDSSRPIVLISGGVGLTPMIAMLNSLAKAPNGRQVTFIHAAINSQTHAMKEYVARLAEENEWLHSYVCYSQPTPEDRAHQSYDKDGFVDLNWLQQILPDPDRDFYLCGPVPMLRMVYRALADWGIAAEQIHYECFGPDIALAIENEAEREESVV